MDLFVTQAVKYGYNFKGKIFILITQYLKALRESYHYDYPY